MSESATGSVGAAWPAADVAFDQLIRLELVEALGRRAALQQGALRRVLDTRLAVLRASAGAGCEHEAPGGEARPGWAPGVPACLPAPGPLCSLVDRLAAHRAARQQAHDPSPAEDPSAARPAVVAAQTLELLRRTWSHLDAERFCAGSLACLPANAGPLHSQHVLHRALTLMRDVAPGYLEHFVAHLSALAALERAGAILGDARDLGGVTDVRPPVAERRRKRRAS